MPRERVVLLPRRTTMGEGGTRGGWTTTAAAASLSRSTPVVELSRPLTAIAMGVIIAARRSALPIHGMRRRAPFVPFVAVVSAGEDITRAMHIIIRNAIGVPIVIAGHYFYDVSYGTLPRGTIPPLSRVDGRTNIGGAGETAGGRPTRQKKMTVSQFHPPPAQPLPRANLVHLSLVSEREAFGFEVASFVVWTRILVARERGRRAFIMSNHSYNLRRRNAGAAPSSSSAADVAPSPSPGDKSSSSSSADYESGTNWVHGGGIEANPYLFVLVVLSPFISLLLAYATSAEMATSSSSSALPFRITHPLTEMVPACLSDLQRCASSTLRAGSSVLPTAAGARMVLSFMGLALALERALPGRVERGPETATGHVPRYVDNGVAHCVVFSLAFLLGSDLGPCGDSSSDYYLGLPLTSATRALCDVYEPYSFGILYDLFPSGLAFLNLFGIVFCIFLTLKGIHYPSTSDNGSSGSWVKDYLWGTELYPRVCGLDLKRFVNCRFSMTFWQLAGLSYCYRSYVLRGNVMDWGLFFSALSQYLYLVKFFVWVSCPCEKTGMNRIGRKLQFLVWD